MSHESGDTSVLLVYVMKAQIFIDEVTWAQTLTTTVRSATELVLYLYQFRYVIWYLEIQMHEIIMQGQVTVYS